MIWWWNPGISWIARPLNNPDTGGKQHTTGLVLKAASHIQIVPAKTFFFYVIKVYFCDLGHVQIETMRRRNKVQYYTRSIDASLKCLGNYLSVTRGSCRRSYLALCSSHLLTLQHLFWLISHGTRTCCADEFPSLRGAHSRSVNDNIRPEKGLLSPLWFGIKS